MRRKSFVLLLALALVLVMAMPAVAADWHEWDAKENISVDKVWTVKFNLPLDRDSINSDSIYIKDSADRLIPAVVSLVDDKTVVVDANNDYEPGEYFLYISDAVKSKTGSCLKQPVKMRFTVNNNENFEVLTYCMWTEYNYRHVVGEVVNNTDNASSLTSVRATFYDEDGNIVASDSDTVPGILNPNGHATFELLLPNNDKIYSVHFRVSQGYEEDPLIMDFKVIDSYFYKDAWDYGKVAVEYKKLSNNEYDSVIMFVGVYDENGNILDADYTYLEEAKTMKQNEKSSADFSFKKGLPDNCNIKVFFSGYKWDF